MQVQSSPRPLSGAVPAQPTDAMPGTERKVQVMIERAAHRQQLFHPLDGLVSSAPVDSPRPADPVLWQPEDNLLPDDTTFDGAACSALQPVSEAG